MNKIFYFPILLIFISCTNLNAQQFSKDTTQNLNNYFPLQKGNWWKYVRNNDTLIITVEDTVVINDNKYYKVVESLTCFVDLPDSIDVRKFKRTFYYRNKFDGLFKKLIIECQPTIQNINIADRGLCALAGTDWVWYDFRNTIHFGFTYSNSMFDDSFVYMYKIDVLSKKQKVKINNRIYSNCFKFHIKEIHLKVDGTYEWFTSGVGMVKRCYGHDKRNCYLLVDYKLHKP